MSSFALLVTASQFANAEQRSSQNLDIGAIVEPGCSVSTERGAAGAIFEAGCPDYVKQSLTRELTVGTEQPGSNGAAVHEQLVLVINF